MWTRIQPDETAVEEDLQALFDEWPNRGRQPRCLLAGTPRALATMSKPSRPAAECFGYSFKSDVLLRGKKRDLLIELKCSDKYEPIAVAEALHHVRFLKEYKGYKRPLHPVVIGSYNAWTRLALSQLGQAFKPDAAISYYEVDILHDGRRTFYWFDAPLHPWRPISSKELPAIVPQREREELAWYFVEETRSFVGCESRCRTRPELLEGRYMMVAGVAGTKPGETYLVWAGEAPACGTSRRRARRLQSDYYLFEGGDTNASAPSLLFSSAHRAGATV